MRQGDVVRKLDGQNVDSSSRFRTLVAALNPGSQVTIEIIRDGKPETLKVTLGEQPAAMAGPSGSGGGPSEGTLRGMAVQDLTPSIRSQLGLPTDVRGVVISDLDPDSPAAQAGLQPGDVIQSINRQPVNSVADFNRLAAQATGEVLLLVNRQGSSAFVPVTPTPQD